MNVGSMWMAAFVLGPASVGLASEQPEVQTASPHARVSLISEHTQLRAGTTAMLGLHFQIDPHWHVYWAGRSDSGGPIEFELKLPDGLSARPAQWPAPRRLVSDGDIVDHVYENELTIIIPVDVSPNFKGPAQISGKVTYVICAGSCLFENANFELSLPITSADAEVTASTQSKMFSATRARLPQTLPTGGESPRLERTPSSLSISVPGASGLTFFPATECGALADFSSTGHTQRANMKLSLDRSEPAGAPITGVLEVRYPDSRPTAWFTIGPSVDQPPTTQAPKAAPAANTRK